MALSKKDVKDTVETIDILNKVIIDLESAADSLSRRGKAGEIVRDDLNGVISFLNDEWIGLHKVLLKSATQ